MDSKNKSDKLPVSICNGRFAHEMEGGVSGALAGAVLGVAAGPPGLLAGAIIGGVLGIVVGATLDTESNRRLARARKLDAEIGVTGGNLGAPHLLHPPASAAASAGARRRLPVGVPTQTLPLPLVRRKI